MRLNLIDLETASHRVADKCEAEAAKADADVAADMAFSADHKQPVGGGYWKAAHAKRLPRDGRRSGTVV